MNELLTYTISGGKALMDLARDYSPNLPSKVEQGLEELGVYVKDFSQAINESLQKGTLLSDVEEFMDDLSNNRIDWRS